MKIQSFVDLHSWQQAHQLVLLVYKMTQLFPKHELFGLSQQIRRAVVSVTSNIAEGFSRNTPKEKNNFYHISLGSLTEVQNQLLIARDVQYIDSKAFTQLGLQTIRVNKLLTGLMRTSGSHTKYVIPNTSYPHVCSH